MLTFPANMFSEEDPVAGDGGIDGIGLALLGITGLAAARRFPSTHDEEHLHGADDLFHADDIPALDPPGTRREPERQA